MSSGWAVLLIAIWFISCAALAWCLIAAGARADELDGLRDAPDDLRSGEPHGDCFPITSEPSAPKDFHSAGDRL